MDKWNFDNMTHTLKNGLKLITIKRNTNIAAVNIGIKIGSLHENDQERGISHFLEHMMFKGTKARNNEILNKDLEFLGGDYNAYTDNLTTVYSASCLSEEIENAVSILADMVMNSKFAKREIKREKGVVLAEIRSSKDNVEDLSFRRLNEFAFEKYALRYDVLGLEQTVESFTKEQLLDYYKKYYTPDNSIVVLVTPFEHKEVLSMIEKIFENWKGKCAIKNDINPEKNIAGVFETYKKQIEQSTITYLYSLLDVQEDEEIALKILNHKLGESSNSILFRELRENKGLAYDIYTCIDLSENLKLMNIFTAIGEESIEESKQTIDKVIENIKNEIIEIDDETLNLMKKIHKTAVLSTIEDSAELCSYVMNQALENLEIDSFIKDMKKLDNLKKEDISKVAKKYLVSPTVHILKSEE